MKNSRPLPLGSRQNGVSDLALRCAHSCLGGEASHLSGPRLTLWVPLSAAAPCWPCGRLGHVKVDGESGVRFHGFCQTQIRKQPSHSPHACQACRRHLVVCIPSLKGVRPSWSHASPPIRRPLWRWHCCSLLRCRLVPQRSLGVCSRGRHRRRSQAHGLEARSICRRVHELLQVRQCRSPAPLPT